MMLARVGEQIGLAYALENVMPRLASRWMFGVSYSDVFPYSVVSAQPRSSAKIRMMFFGGLRRGSGLRLPRAETD